MSLTNKVIVDGPRLAAGIDAIVKIKPGLSEHIGYEKALREIAEQDKVSVIQNKDYKGRMMVRIPDGLMLDLFKEFGMNQPSVSIRRTEMR